MSAIRDMPESVDDPRRIAIVTPAPRASRGGNRATALRIAGLLRAAGHHPRILTPDQLLLEHSQLDDDDLLLAVHASKTAAAALRTTDRRPTLPLVTLLAGTDIYPEFRPDPATLQALERARALVALQRHAIDVLPTPLRQRARTIVQSATAAPDVARAERFTLLTLAHLRPVKGQLHAVEAMARLAPELDVRLLLAGGTIDHDYAERVRTVIAAEPRVTWLGELSRRDGKRLLREAHALLVPSTSEGGANVVSEAIAAGTPVLCSAVPGNLGLLGDDWPATFAPADVDDLAALLARAAGDRPFLDALRRRTLALQPMVAPAAERDAWCRLLRELT